MRAHRSPVNSGAVRRVGASRVCCAMAPSEARSRAAPTAHDNARAGAAGRPLRFPPDLLPCGRTATAASAAALAFSDTGTSGITGDGYLCADPFERLVRNG